MGKLQSPLPPKYKYRYEQILNLIALSGEIPTDLYRYIGVSNDTYRKAISDLRKKELLRTVNANQLRGYVLTVEGKRYLRNKSSLQLTFSDIQTQTSDVQRRRRNQYFAILYACFDRLQIPYEPTVKPKREQYRIAAKDLVFYSAAEYKTELGERGASFKGSRSQGILVGKGKVHPIYITNKQLIEFNTAEFGLVNQISKDYFDGGDIDNAIIFCPDIKAVSGVLNDIIHFEEKGKGINILHSSYFKDVHIIPLDDTLGISLRTIYSSDKLIEFFAKKLNINTHNTYYQCDGYINEAEIVIFMFTMTAAKLKTFLSINRRQNKKGHIICFDYLAPVIKSQITPDNNVSIKTIKADGAIVQRLLSQSETL